MLEELGVYIKVAVDIGKLPGRATICMRTASRVQSGRRQQAGSNLGANGTFTRTCLRIVELSKSAPKSGDGNFRCQIQEY